MIEILWYHEALKDKAAITAGELLFLYHKKKYSRNVITFKCILILHSAFPSQQTLFHLNKVDIRAQYFILNVVIRGEQQPWNDSLTGPIHRLH